MSRVLQDPRGSKVSLEPWAHREIRASRSVGRKESLDLEGGLVVTAEMDSLDLWGPLVFREQMAIRVSLDATAPPENLVRQAPPAFLEIPEHLVDEESPVSLALKADRVGTELTVSPASTEKTALLARLDPEDFLDILVPLVTLERLDLRESEARRE